MADVYKVKDLALKYDVNEHSVLAWIDSEELSAFNVGKKAVSKIPRWRVTAEALTDFERLRLAPTSPKPSKRRRKRQPTTIERY